MKNVVKFFKFVAGLMVVSAFVGCETGLGQALDLTAPEITITSPSDGDNVHKSIRIEGTCKDNESVTGVTIEERTQDGSFISLGRGVVNGENWYADITLEEGDRFIICTAKDAAGNSSAKSKAVLTLIVDETAPDAKDWYVDRGNNTQVALMSLEKLQNIDIGLAVNKFVPQNEKFTVKGQFSDAISISEITLSLYEGDDADAIISKTVTAASGSIYSPSWEFTHDELKAKKDSLKTGKHYLKAVYEAKDNAGNIRKTTAGHFLWYPESDYPGIQQSGTDENEKLLVNAGSSIPLHFFDDDEIKEIGYAFVTEEFKKNPGGDGKSEITLDNLENYVTKVTNIGDSEYPMQVSTLKADGSAMTSGTYYLLAYVKEKNNYIKKRLIEVSLMDAAKPLLIIESPLENEAPTIITDGAGAASTFKFIGYSYDTSGSKLVKIAYIPGTSYATAEAKQNRAKALFANESLKASDEIIKTYTFKPAGSKDKPNASTNLIEEKFEFTFDLLTDFPVEKNKQKFFMLMLEDIDKNIVYKQVIVDADTDKPEISIQSPKDDMTVIDYSNNNLVFKFAAIKASGLGIDENTYKLSRVAKAGSKEADFVCTFENGKLSWVDPVQKDYVKVEIDKSELAKWANGDDGYNADAQPVFLLEGSDILGNAGSATRTVVLSPLPVLEAITVDQAAGKYCTSKVITFQAKFSDTVKVTGSPRLKLSGIKSKKDDAEDLVDVVRYATYKSESTNSDTIKFEYTVQKGDVSDGISCAGLKIDLNNGKIETGTQGTGSADILYKSEKNFWDSTDLSVKRKIEFDGVNPEIKNITATITNVELFEGYRYGKEASEVLVTVEFTEPVSISGTANLTINGLTFTQYSMSIDGTKITYSYNVCSTKNGNTKTSFNDEKLLCNSASCFNFAGKNIKDKAGNDLTAGSDSYDIQVKLDTTIPSAPSVLGLTQKIYNKSPKFTVVKDSSDTDIKKIEVSVDNGQTWVNYTGKQTPKEKTATEDGDPWYWVIDSDDDNKEKMAIRTGGTYNIIAKATDKAGNISVNSDPIEVILNDQFPEILDIKVACENGNYKNDDELVFKVFLSDTVKPYTANDATLTFETINAASGSVAKTLKVEPSPTDISGADIPTSVLEFKHKVTEGDKYNGIHIKSIALTNLQDKYNNKQGTETSARITELTGDATGGCYRTGIKVDGSAPKIVSTTPAKGKVATNVNASTGLLTVSITFDEVVYKESGTITLQRKGNWGIPAVMTVEDFNSVYNSSKLTTADREILKITESGTGTGNELLDTRTGIAVGPYKKITHGLTKDSSNTDELASGSPDTETKFVLDFNLGLFNGETCIDPYGKAVNVAVADIRKVFEKAGYHQHSVQMNSSKITTTDNKTYNIEFPVKIQEGIEWELIISEGSFRDEVGNLFKGLKSENAEGYNPATDESYTLWSNKASIPVVRVDRYSHGYGAIEPKSTSATIFDTKNLTSSSNTTNFSNITKYCSANGSLTDNTGGKIAPTGYVRVRIDTQTPGAAIKYRTIEKGAFDATTGKTVSGSIKWTRYVLNNGVNASQATGTSSTSAENGYLFNDNTNDSQRCSVSEIPDATASELNNKTATFTTVTPVNNAGVIIVVGDGKYQTARKDYVAAYATLASAKTDANASMTDSIIGAEGVFKTVIFSKKYQNNNQFNIEGGTFMGGEPNVSGFPVRDGESEQYSKNAYHIDDTDNQNIWNSYEIVSTNWAILLRESANSKNYPRSSYGQATYVCGYIHY